MAENYATTQKEELEESIDTVQAQNQADAAEYGSKYETIKEQLEADAVARPQENIQQIEQEVGQLAQDQQLDLMDGYGQLSQLIAGELSLMAQAQEDFMERSQVMMENYTEALSEGLPYLEKQRDMQLEAIRMAQSGGGGSQWNRSDYAEAGVLEPADFIEAAESIGLTEEDLSEQSFQVTDMWTGDASNVYGEAEAIEKLWGINYETLQADFVDGEGDGKTLYPELIEYDNLYRLFARSDSNGLDDGGFFFTPEQIDQIVMEKLTLGTLTDEQMERLDRFRYLNTQATNYANGIPLEDLDEATWVERFGAFGTGEGQQNMYEHPATKKKREYWEGRDEFDTSSEQRLGDFLRRAEELRGDPRKEDRQLEYGFTTVSSEIEDTPDSKLNYPDHWEDHDRRNWDQIQAGSNRFAEEYVDKLTEDFRAMGGDVTLDTVFNPAKAGAGDRGLEMYSGMRTPQDWLDEFEQDMQPYIGEAGVTQREFGQAAQSLSAQYGKHANKNLTGSDFSEVLSRAKAIGEERRKEQERRDAVRKTNWSDVGNDLLRDFGSADSYLGLF